MTIKRIALLMNLRTDMIAGRRGGGFAVNVHDLSGDIVRGVETDAYPPKSGLKRNSQGPGLAEGGEKVYGGSKSILEVE